MLRVARRNAGLETLETIEIADTERLIETALRPSAAAQPRRDHQLRRGALNNARGHKEKGPVFRPALILQD
jgi:hypothetical protein